MSLNVYKGVNVCILVSLKTLGIGRKSLPNIRHEDVQHQTHGYLCNGDMPAAMIRHIAME